MKSRPWTRKAPATTERWVRRRATGVVAVGHPAMVGVRGAAAQRATPDSCAGLGLIHRLSGTPLAPSARHRARALRWRGDAADPDRPVLRRDRRSPAGPPSRGGAPSRARSATRSPPSCAARRRCASSSPGARMPGCTPAARSRTSTSTRPVGEACGAAPAARAEEAPPPGCAASSPPTSPCGGSRRRRTGFDARFSALRRRYLYRICDDAGRARPAAPARHRAGPRPARRRGHGRGGPQPARACTTSRPSAGAARAPRPCARCSTTAGTARRDGTVEATVVADAFCHSMVRSLVGAVVPVGEGRLDVDVPRRCSQRWGPRLPGAR